VVTIVYVALVASIGVYALLVLFLPAGGHGPPPSPAIRWALLALGTGEYLAATALARWRLSSHGGASLEHVRSFFLIRFAAAEAIAVFGLAVHFLGGAMTSVLPFFAASIAAFAFAYPTREAFEQPGDVGS
jgi:hypothetical protein